MSTKELKCPNCGAEVAFTSPGTLVVVCTHCEYASYRTDVALESIGKVAELAVLDSSFRLGTRGRFEGESFVVRGQLQLDHGAGPWNEWCAEVTEATETTRGKWLWIAEAQGRVSVMRPVEGRELPAELEMGDEVKLDGGEPFGVHELGQGTLTSAAGELPIRIAPGARTRYADLSRAGGGFATLDWTHDEPEAFVGRHVKLAELELEPGTLPEHEPKRVAAQRIACKNCGAALELFDPASAEIVVCASCHVLLDVTSEKHVVKQAQEQLRATPLIRLGLETSLRGENVRVLGFLSRAVRAEGKLYPWREYLLRTEDGEYRWLVENNGHWLLATPIEPGAVKRGKRSASYGGTTYRHFDGGKAEVLAVLGEFYWQVRVGSQADVDDYVNGPRMISVEREEKEVAASASVHLEPAEVARAFQLQKPPLQHGVGPLQPNPHPVASAWGTCGLAFALAMVFFLGRLVTSEQRQVLSGSFGPAPASSSEEKVDFSEPFDITASHGNVRIELTAPLDNGWLGVNGALVEETTGAVTVFAVAAEYYHGISDGSSWSEGGFTGRAWIGPVPAGRYRLRLASAGYDNGCGKPYSIRAVSDVPRGLYLGLAALALLVLPAAITVLALLFEKRRWDTSAHPWGES